MEEMEELSEFEKMIRERCLQKGCERPRGYDTCGFDKTVAAERKKLPLVRGADGLRRKIIHKEVEQ